LLEVIDNGPGIDPAVKERIFDPYFTTKPVGEGTGLGLATVHGIVKSYEGAISVHSELGKGSTFKVYLPAGLKEFETENKLSASIRQGDETILFVDDEDALVEMGYEVLQELGYKVKACGSSQEALEVFQERPGDFDLVITDLTMPQMNGIELSRNLIRLRPDIPIILCTGFSGKITPESAKAAGIKAVLMKPLVIANLAETIRAMLDDGVYRET
jgi:CheY-like chemotaxis protein